jgi:hypothetical protein
VKPTKRVIRTFVAVTSLMKTAISMIRATIRRTSVADRDQPINAFKNHPPEILKEVMNMAEQKSRQCCSLEKTRLMEELRKCDCSGSYEEFHQCYRDAARESGDRARSCMFA